MSDINIIYCKKLDKSNAKQEDFAKLPPENYSLKIWTPSIFKVVPNGLPFRIFVGWWIFYFPRLLRDFSYIVLIVYYNDKAVHYTAITSKSWKFPFMKSDDIQIGPSWTDVEHRRKGIGSYVIQKILEIKGKDGTKFWWVAREENMISRRFIRKAGFSEYGNATRKEKFGIGYFECNPLR